jgi:hypothetical protein
MFSIRRLAGSAGKRDPQWRSGLGEARQQHRQPRHGRPADGGGAGTRQSQMSDTNIDTLRGKFPIMAELSTGFIRSLAAAEFLSLKEASFLPRRSTLRNN